MRIFFISSRSFLRISSEYIFGDVGLAAAFSGSSGKGFFPDFVLNERLHKTRGVITIDIDINRYFFIMVLFNYILITFKKEKGYSTSVLKLHRIIESMNVRIL